MFSILVAIFEIAMMAAIIVFIPLTLIFRVLSVIKHEKPLKEALLIVLLPFSLGYYMYLKEEEKSKIYNILIYSFLALTVIGILFTVYQWMPPIFN